MLTAVLAGHMDITNNRCTFNGGAMQPEGTPYTTCSVGKPKTGQGLAIAKMWAWTMATPVPLVTPEPALQALTQQLVERFAP